MADLARKFLLAERLKRLRDQKLTQKTATEEVSKRPPQPKGLVLKYTVFLKGYQRQINKATLELLKPLIKVVVAFRQDGLNEDTAAIFELITKEVLKFMVSDVLKIGITNQSNAIWAWNDQKYNNKVFNLIGMNDLPASIKVGTSQSWIQENLSLIKNVNSDQVAKLETLFYRAARDGNRASTILGDVRKIMGSSEQRATLIARDQTTKLQGQIDRQKQRDAGVTHYIWRTSQDERVRPRHEDRENVRFAWDSPPEDGHPGQPVQCRCFAEPDVEGLLSDLGVPEVDEDGREITRQETPKAKKKKKRPAPSTETAEQKREAASLKRSREKYQTDLKTASNRLTNIQERLASGDVSLAEAQDELVTVDRLFKNLKRRKI
jgi:SPP1 gp7 family putative phage head morphogenesis protein